MPVTIFLAILELIRLNEIIVTQHDAFSEIEIKRNPNVVKLSDEQETARHSNATVDEEDTDEVMPEAVGDSDFVDTEVVNDNANTEADMNADTNADIIKESEDQ